MKNKIFELFRKKHNVEIYTLTLSNTREELEEIKEQINRKEANKIYFFKIESPTHNRYEVALAMELLNGDIEIYETQLNCDREPRKAEIEELIEFIESLSIQSSKMFFIIKSDKYFDFDKIKENPNILIPYMRTAEQITNIKDLKNFLCE